MPINLSSLLVTSFLYLFQTTYYTVREMLIFGSRKSGKTKHVALRIILRAMRDRDYNALVMRKVASELRTSVKEELEWAIYTLGVAHLWVYKVQAREFIYKPTGNKILLRGIAVNPTSGKPSLSGLNVSHGQIKDCWMEEAWEFTQVDYNMIRQTLRGGLYTMIITGNPYFSGIWCVKKLIDVLEPSLDILKEKGEQFIHMQGNDVDQFETIGHWNNFQVNTKLSKEDIMERWEEKRTNPKDFITTGYGYPGSPTGTILGDLVDRIQWGTYEEFHTNCVEFDGGVDVGLTSDATAAVFGGWDKKWNEWLAGEYYHSNGSKEANQFSDNGVWRRKDPQEIAEDVLNFFMMYYETWYKYKQELKIAVDSADRAFISILNQKAKNQGVGAIIKFVPTIGEDEGKKYIETRIIEERQALAHQKIYMVKLDGRNVMEQLYYEMENLPWKITAMTQQAKMERDDTKVPDHITNAWEYKRRKRTKEQLAHIGL